MKGSGQKSKSRRSSVRRADELDAALTELFSTGSSFLQSYPWEWEHDRWMELLVTVLIEAAEVPPRVARDCVAALDGFDMVTVDALVGATSNNGSLALLENLIARAGVDADESARVADVMVSVARVVSSDLGGKVQRLLRQHGEALAADMVRVLCRGGVEKRAAESAATLWLQNTCNLPILSRHDPHVEAFCRAAKVSEAELVESADRVDVNIAVLDDLLALADPKPQRQVGGGRR